MLKNTNYFVATTTGRFILTLYEQRVNRDDLPFFLGLLDHLSANGIACPTPVRSNNGTQVTELAGRAAAIVTFLEGFCITRPEPAHCYDVGQTLAQLHLAGKSYDKHRANALGIADWRPLYTQITTEANTIAPGLSDLISKELDWLEKNWPTDLETGVIHADLFPDNVFFLGNKLSGLIDFYFACNDAFALDVAICLNAWCFDEKLRLSKAHSDALLRGYQSARALSSKERAALPTLCRGSAMRFLLTRCFDWLNTRQDALVRLHDPLDYLKRLTVHQEISNPDQYGLER